MLNQSYVLTYNRKATRDKSPKDSYSLANQAMRCRAFCEEHNLMVIDVLAEVRSGIESGEHPAL